MAHGTDMGPTTIVPDPVIEAYQKDVDRTLLRENLKLTVEERWRKLIDTLRFLREWQGAGRSGPR